MTVVNRSSMFGTLGSIYLIITSILVRGLFTYNLSLALNLILLHLPLVLLGSTHVEIVDDVRNVSHTTVRSWLLTAFLLYLLSIDLLLSLTCLLLVHWRFSSRITITPDEYVSTLSIIVEGMDMCWLFIPKRKDWCRIRFR